jgi:hypothetical protein
MQNSPFLLGLRCILALSPSPSDPNPTSAASKALRRSTSARLARETGERIDQLLTEAGEDDDATPSIEIVQALSLLGLYEFGQNFNAARNRMRMNLAVQTAMEIGLHRVDERGWTGEATSPEGGDIVTEMKRRTWWIVFAGMLISGLISGKVSRAVSEGVTCRQADLLPGMPSNRSAGSSIRTTRGSSASTLLALWGMR